MRRTPRVIAFFLPQFHEIPENNEWWGEGFTEWTNTRRATALFSGHDQPRTPAGERYFDLSDPAELRRQSEQARANGLDAFCFYYYWFDGKRLLERPLDLYAQMADALPFCVSWANENWTRRWDGKDHEVLVGQRYTEDTAEQIYSDLRQYLTAPHYLRVDGNPVVLVHRADHIPAASGFSTRLRMLAVADGLPGLHLVASETVQGIDPRPLGFNAVAEFPPVGRNGLGNVLLQAPQDLPRDFRGRLLSYGRIARRSASRPAPPFTRYRGVMPGWDNTARRAKSATIYVGHSPARYQWWLEQALAHEERERGERGMVFVNAWNEWAEGAYLQPDSTHGDAYLTATRAAVQRAASGCLPDPALPPDDSTPRRGRLPHARSLALSAATSGVRVLRQVHRATTHLARRRRAGA